MLRIAEFGSIVSTTATAYQPRVYGDAHAGGWDGYVVFFPIGIGRVISTPREATHDSLESLQMWASTLDRAYLEGALDRALKASGGVAIPSIPDLPAAEASAAEDAIALHRAAARAGADAQSALLEARAHEQAALLAREDAAELTEHKEDLEQLAADTIRVEAETAAEVHESAARNARAVAADAAKRTKRRQSGKRQSGKKRG